MAKKMTQARRDISNSLPAKDMCLAEEYEVYCYKVLGNNNKNTLHNDLAVRFPVESYNGKNYIFIAYVCKLSAIFMLPMRSREDESMI